jgi:hypothetical protein
MSMAEDWVSAREHSVNGLEDSSQKHSMRVEIPRGSGSIYVSQSANLTSSHRPIFSGFLPIETSSCNSALPAEEPEIRDPFGFLETSPDCETARKRDNYVELRRGWSSSMKPPVPSWFKKVIKLCLYILSVKPRVIGWNSGGDDGPILDSEIEDIGVQNAAGMTKTWTYPELISCYILWVTLIHGFLFISVSYENMIFLNF